MPSEEMERGFMALTRSFLRGLKLDEEQVSAIIEAHTETVDGLKSVNAEIQGKLDTATADLAAAKKTDWEQKYNALNQDFEAYKADQVARQAKQAKESAYTALLREANVSEKRIPSILKITDIDALELADDGTLKDAESVKTGIETEWVDFITASGTKGAKVDKPPASATGKAAFESMSLAEKMRFANDHPAEYEMYSK